MANPQAKYLVWCRRDAKLARQYIREALAIAGRDLKAAKTDDARFYAQESARYAFLANPSLREVEL